jgi:hypothetical protein
MRIRFAPRRGSVELELRDILGGSPFAKWYRGDERDIPAGAKVPFAGTNGPPVPMDLATAIFHHGPDFVDAATGKNPLYVCATCGADALAEHAFDYDKYERIPFVDDAGNRVCIPCFLSTHPERLPYFKYTLKYARDAKDVIAKAEAIIAKKAAPAAGPRAEAQPVEAPKVNA